jgi:uncharacterized protein (TIGR02145 family)
MKKGNNDWIFKLAIVGLIIILQNSCKKKDDNNAVGTITDIDGNIYHTVQIGTQLWMAENLKTTRYNDGTEIPLVTNKQEWLDLSTSGYCWYNNDPATYKITYGALYNWYAVNTGKLAPKGWHVPSDAEWTTLINYLGGESIAGGKMKSTGTIEAGTGLWPYPNVGATNESGLAAIPAGKRNDGGSFSSIGYNCELWSSSECDYSTYSAWYQHLSCYLINVDRIGYLKINGFSVRCVKD